LASQGAAAAPPTTAQQQQQQQHASVSVFSPPCGQDRSMLRGLVAARDIHAGEVILQETCCLEGRAYVGGAVSSVWALLHAVLADPRQADLLAWLRATFPSPPPPAEWDAGDALLLALTAQHLPTSPCSSKQAIKHLYAILCSINLTLSTSPLHDNNEHNEQQQQQQQQAAAVGIFRTLAFINHSCDPNAHLRDVDPATGVATLVAVRSIAKGDAVTMAYMDEKTLVWPKEARQQYLQAHFGFTCTCTRCVH
jgi:hypothetical protein